MLEEALKLYGLAAIPGTKHNEHILLMFHSAGFDWVENDETPWCSAFMNYVAIKAGYEGTDSLLARSWMDWGYPVQAPSESPQLGDVVVFWRKSPNSIYGHVGLYINETKSRVLCLGGNQSQQVQISSYPKSRVLGYRRY